MIESLCMISAKFSCCILMIDSYFPHAINVSYPRLPYGTSFSSLTSCVSILASFCVWTKSLMCKDVVNRDSTCQSIFRRLCTAKKIEDFSFPVSRPDDVSSRPDAHLSTVPSVWTTCSSRPDARQTSIIHPDDVSLRPDPPLCLEGSIQLASVRTFQ
jgi:hypothetical protein